jgi:ribosome maturation factor RimP
MQLGGFQSRPFFLLNSQAQFADRRSQMTWQQAIDRTVTGLGYELVELERSGGGLLRVTIDREPGHVYPTGPSEFVTVDDCEAVTRQLQYVLEVEQCDYARLEVSSPGLDRPLKTEAHYLRFAGHEVEITLKLPMPGAAGRKKFKGELQAREGVQGGWRLLLADDSAPAPKKGMPPKKKSVEAQPQQALDFVFDEVREAHLIPVIDFKGRPANQQAGAPAPAGD